jgi:hypothetical protein
MFTAVATVFQQIMTELNGVETEEERIMAITKIVLKHLKQNNKYPQGTGLLTNTDKYNCCVDVMYC